VLATETCYLLELVPLCVPAHHNLNNQQLKPNLFK
jgi:hypothetical protein